MDLKSPTRSSYRKIGRGDNFSVCSRLMLSPYTVRMYKNTSCELKWRNNTLMTNEF